MIPTFLSSRNADYSPKLLICIGNCLLTFLLVELIGILNSINTGLRS